MQRELDALRSRLDILDLAREYLRDLRRSGKSWAALCPFHEEKTPSFHLDPDRGLFYCFGCHKGGDTIGLYMELERLEFKDAIEALCERFGLPRPNWGIQGAKASGEEKTKAAVKKALSLAATLYAEALQLREDPQAEEARQYCLHRRQMDKNIMQGYRMGYAPRMSNWLYTAMVSKHGIDPRILEKAGLALVSSRDGRYLDFFRGRIVFPVLDLSGHVCGFGGRIIPSEMGLGRDSEGPKYLNSPDTLLFKKSDTLYGLAQHKSYIREKDKAYVVEGYFDVLGLAQGGLPLAVSPMGGNLTASHARTLKRFARNAVLLFDPDTAGIAGAIRAGRILLAVGVTIKLMRLPSGLDPDEFMLKYGRATFEELEAREAKSLLDFEIESRLAGRSVARLGLDERQALAKEMMPTLSAITGEIERRESVVSLAQALRLSEVGLERELFKNMNQAQGASSAASRPAGSASPAVGSPRARVNPAASFLSLEEELLGMAVVDKQSVRDALAQAGIKAADFVEPRIAQYVLGETQAQAVLLPDPRWQEMISRAALSQPDHLSTDDLKKRVTGFVQEMRQRVLTRELRELREVIRRARAKGSAVEPEMLKRFQEISKQMKGFVRES